MRGARHVTALGAEGSECKLLVIKPERNRELDVMNDKDCLDDLKQREYLDDLKESDCFYDLKEKAYLDELQEDDTLDDMKGRACLDQCFSNARPRPGTGP